VNENGDRASSAVIANLRSRLADAEGALRAINAGEVDTLVVKCKNGLRVFTLESDEHAYRVLIESMNEGALTLTSKGVILYANGCFARLVNCPLEQVLGSSIHRFLKTGDQKSLRSQLSNSMLSGSKFRAFLRSGSESHRPVHFSIRPLKKVSAEIAAFGIVVTDLTEVQSLEERLRSLANRVVQAQECERNRLSIELHDNITQLLCAVVARSHGLASILAEQDARAQVEAIALREMLGSVAGEVERISRHLRPGVLHELGLIAVIRETIAIFSRSTGNPIRLVGERLSVELQAETELAMYRILQEAVKNVEKHACARNVLVRIRQLKSHIVLQITDDGVGFNAARRDAGYLGRDRLGLLGMHERATSVGGVLVITSARGAGTTIKASMPVRIPTTSALTRNGRSANLAG